MGPLKHLSVDYSLRITSSFRYLCILFHPPLSGSVYSTLEPHYKNKVEQNIVSSLNPQFSRKINVEIISR